jgi:hypothetical protein
VSIILDNAAKTLVAFLNKNIDDIQQDDAFTRFKIPLSEYFSYFPFEGQQNCEPPRGKPRGITSGVARVQAALAPYLLRPDAQCSA